MDEAIAILQAIVRGAALLGFGYVVGRMMGYEAGQRDFVRLSTPPPQPPPVAGENRDAADYWWNNGKRPDLEGP